MGVMGTWVFNVLLYLMYTFSPATYVALVEAGAPCWNYHAEIAGTDDPNQPPPCFYEVPKAQAQPHKAVR